MKRISFTSPDEPNLALKRLMAKEMVNGKLLAEWTGMRYQTLMDRLNGKSEFTASEIKKVAEAMRITDIKKYFLGGE